MHLEELAEGNSFLHKLDPRVKIITFLCLSLCSLFSDSYLTLLGYLFMALGLLLLTRIPFSVISKRLFLINFFLILLWLSLLLGDLLKFHLFKGGLLLDSQTLSLGLSITLKSNVLFIATLSLLATTPLSALTHALAHLKVPSKLALLFHLSYRYLSLLHQEYDKMRLGVLARGFRAKTSLHTYRIYSYLLGMLVIKSLKKAEDLYLAMLARGYKGFYPMFEHFKYQRQDWFFLILTNLLILMIFTFVR